MFCFGVGLGVVDGFVELLALVVMFVGSVLCFLVGLGFRIDFLGWCILV